MVLIRVYTSPRKVELAISGVPFCRINNNTPARPIARPLPLRNEILSFNIRAAKTKANIGFVESIIDEFIGDVKFSPARKRTWFITTPKKEHPKRYNRSLRLTGSLGIKRLEIQNNPTPRRLLNEARANGLIWSGITAFATE